jgi:hypothetical protein
VKEQRFLIKKIRNVDTKMGIGRIMRCKNKEEFQKLGKYIIEREGK